MLAISAIMYTGNFVSRLCKYMCFPILQNFAVIDWWIVSHFFAITITDPELQDKRAIERVAMKEYYEKHGGGDHH
jgi:hypothetical protein